VKRRRRSLPVTRGLRSLRLVPPEACDVESGRASDRTAHLVTVDATTSLPGLHDAYRNSSYVLSTVSCGVRHLARPDSRQMRVTAHQSQFCPPRPSTGLHSSQLGGACEAGRELKRPRSQRVVHREPERSCRGPTRGLVVPTLRTVAATFQTDIKHARRSRLLARGGPGAETVAALSTAPDTDSGGQNARLALSNALAAT
jgi:hypothetical protein